MFSIGLKSLLYWSIRVATNLENSGNLKNCQNLKETDIFVGKTWKTQGKRELCDILAGENIFERIFLLKLLREKFENTLEISENTQGI